MILKFGFSNFFSFKESAAISFKLDLNCPVSVSKGHDVSPVLGVKGANGSGKTQLLKGVAFLGNFCANSFSNKPEEGAGVSAFFESKSPTEFFIEFRIKSSTYLYELSLTNDEIKRETLYRTTKKKTKLFDRVGNRIEYCVATLKQLLILKLRRNASIISTGNQYEIKALSEIHNFFDKFYTNVFFSGHRDWVKISTASKFLGANKKALAFVRNFLSECDVGISDVNIKTIKNKDGEEESFPQFIHEANGMKFPINDLSESSGTKTLFKWLPLYYISLATGGLLIVDEMDMNLHPHILPKILNLFLDEETNPHGAQLIFATHDSEILELLGRYRTYLVSKEQNESFTYRLDEIPGDVLRNDRPIRPVYNSGRVGGVPRL